MIVTTVFFPLAIALIAFLIPSHILRRIVLILTTGCHTALCIMMYLCPPQPEWNGWVALDPLGLLFLLIISVLFFLSSIYTSGYLHKGVEDKPSTDYKGDGYRKRDPERVFIACLLCFLSTMSMVTVSQHLGLMWVAIEATTLASAPLIYFYKSAHSLEATWKYLVICSVGIGLALLGTIFLATAAYHEGRSTPLILSNLLEVAKEMNTVWLEAAFLLLLVGYGTKMGLAPLHTWLPDAHSEAPAPVSALFSGVLLNCAFLGILRIYQIFVAAGNAIFAQNLLLVFGMLSMIVASTFILRQQEYKRMLAYSSVEHMGILSLGIGLGGYFPVMLHTLNHSLTKAMLFYTSGNILIAYQTKAASNVRGCLKYIPITGVLWVAGFFAITGTPPFGTFVSEFNILGVAVKQGNYIIAAAYLFFLAVIFIGMANIFLPMAQGAFPSENQPKESVLRLISPLILLVCILILGLYIPDWLKDILQSSADLLQTPIKLPGGK